MEGVSDIVGSTENDCDSLKLSEADMVASTVGLLVPFVSERVFSVIVIESGKLGDDDLVSLLFVGLKRESLMVTDSD